MRAIETKYQGYRFRSRLEARWAVFFDALGICWKYEPEGFELSDGTAYLPDFWLPIQEHVHPGAGHWFEIKGAAPTPFELEKARALSSECVHRVFLVAGDPLENQAWAFSGGAETSAAFVWESEFYYRRKGARDLTFREYVDEVLCGFRIHEPYEVQRRALVRAAAEKARSARFEFGESG